MPKSPATTKRVRKSTRVQPTKKERESILESDHELADGNYDEIQKKRERTYPTDRQAKPQKRTKNAAPRINAEKEAMYAQAQKMAKEQATSGVNMLKEVQEKLREMYDQELKFEKLQEDCRLPSLTHDEIFEQLQEFYNPMYNELRNRRREKISDISRMLQTNGPSRQEALKEMSKKTRRQLEQAKLREKEASDAAELIKRVKNMLRV